MMCTAHSLNWGEVRDMAGEETKDKAGEEVGMGLRVAHTERELNGKARRKNAHRM